MIVNNNMIDSLLDYSTSIKNNTEIIMKTTNTIDIVIDKQETFSTVFTLFQMNYENCMKYPLCESYHKSFEDCVGLYSCIICKQQCTITNPIYTTLNYYYNFLHICSECIRIAIDIGKLSKIKVNRLGYEPTFCYSLKQIKNIRLELMTWDTKYHKCWIPTIRIIKTSIIREEFVYPIYKNESIKSIESIEWFEEIITKRRKFIKDIENCVTFNDQIITILLISKYRKNTICFCFIKSIAFIVIKYLAYDWDNNNKENIIIN